VRSARQHAYLGFYDESIKSFNKALESIRRHYKGLDDQILTNEWKTTEKDLFTEMSVVKDLKNIVQGLKNEIQQMDTSTMTLEQKSKVKDVFRQAADVLQKMEQNRAS